LVAKFIGDIYKLTGKQYQVSQGLLEYLMAQEWRGNVRELENLLQRMCVFTPNSIIRKEDLPNGATPYFAPETDTVRPLKEIELEAIHQALRITRGNYSEAANLLGVTKSTLYRKVRPSSAFPSMFGQV
jgi:DNA-binding NtrC family response regulator